MKKCLFDLSHIGPYNHPSVNNIKRLQENLENKKELTWDGMNMLNR